MARDAKDFGNRMVLTPADVHNVAFSRPRIGKRGYNEQEVDIFIDLVEQELTRHLQKETELRSRCAELLKRAGTLDRREAELSEREAALVQYEHDVRAWESRVREQEARLAQRAGGLAKRANPLPQQLAQIRHREAQVAGREAELAQWADELGRREAELRLRVQQQPATVLPIAADAAAGQAPRAYRHAQPLRAVPKSAASNGSARIDEVRAVASVRGRHDMERMAIRAVTDQLGNTVTETVHERTRRALLDHDSPAAPADHQVELERLKAENAELNRSLRLLKAAAASLAAALDRP
ncbi:MULTISPECIES: DivIVA domain-containing protein [unclassified Mycobacterium]|uniref:DivIVA domain-containing protein n=1 Tax=unclassified Mycobacterium TaxID=2642494 RepID=UPI0007FC711A|nr:MULTISPECIES: DivIVA domain-containing protein [unclassified Mycobacterium]OBI19475.1 hypothetical protein A5713_15925 [Mycobacterium sp. E2497]